MFVTIYWLPLVLIWILKVGRYYSLPEAKEVLTHSRFHLEIIIAFYSALRELLDAITLIGIYRYLLKDTRFGVKMFVPKVTAISKRIPSIPFYFTIDKSTLILAAFFIVSAGLYRLGDHVVREFVVDQMRESQPTEPFNVWFVWQSLILRLQAWSFLYFIIASQLCLIGPYIAIATRVTRQKLWRNIVAVKNNRLQVFAVQFIIGLCLNIIWMVPLLVIYLVDQKNFLSIWINWWRYVSLVISIPFGFIALVLPAIFCAESFKFLGVPDESRQ